MNTRSLFKSSRYAAAVSIIAASLFGVGGKVSATILFSDNFNTDSSANWTLNVAAAANAAQQDAVFAFDYSGFGIPPAPGSADTLGLRLRSNIPGSAAAPVTTRPVQVVSGLSISPTGKDFGTSYHVTFYAWINFNGAANASGLADNGASEGGTHNVLFSVGTAGNVPLVVGNTTLAAGASMDGIGFATTGDGGITSDYRVYPKSGTISAAGSGVYAAGTANDANSISPLGNVNLYYQMIPSLAPHTAPPVQQTLSTAEYGSDAANTQAGQTQIGAFGFAWHKVDLIKFGNAVKWTIDNTSIAAIDVTSLLPLGGNNIALGDSDVNTSTTRHPSLLFSLFDNLVVTDVVGIPSIQANVVSHNLTLSWPEATGVGYVLQTTASLAPPVSWSNVTNIVTTTSGTISVSLPATNSANFFRLKFP